MIDIANQIGSNTRGLQNPDIQQESSNNNSSVSIQDDGAVDPGGGIDPVRHGVEPPQDQPPILAQIEVHQANDDQHQGRNNRPQGRQPQIPVQRINVAQNHNNQNQGRGQERRPNGAQEIVFKKLLSRQPQRRHGR